MKLKLTFSLLPLCISAIAGDIVIYPNGIATNNIAHDTSCPGDNRGQATTNDLPLVLYSFLP